MQIIQQLKLKLQDALHFNHCKIANILYVDILPVIQFFDNATHYQIEGFNSAVFADELWRFLGFN